MNVVVVDESLPSTITMDDERSVSIDRSFVQLVSLVRKGAVWMGEYLLFFFFLDHACLDRKKKKK